MKNIGYMFGLFYKSFKVKNWINFQFYVAVIINSKTDISKYSYSNNVKDEYTDGKHMDGKFNATTRVMLPRI